ncbi:MAG: hypothetical protein ACRDFS_12525, partial [Chloroflexota bacterium]
LAFGGLTVTQRGAKPASAYDLLRQAMAASFPSSGSSRVTYTSLPWYKLPKASVAYAGRHEVLARWFVRDATHFRIVMQVVKPVLESGTETVVVNGRSFSAYDRRTGAAWHSTIPASALPGAESYLFGLFTTGEFGSPQAVSSPATSIRAFLHLVRKNASDFGGSVRLLGQTHLLGQPVDIVDYGPLRVTACVRYGAGRSPNGARRCLQGHGVGRARVWINSHHHLILRYREYGLLAQSSVIQTNFRYQVTSIHFPASAPRRKLSAPHPAGQRRPWGSFGRTESGNGVFLPVAAFAPICSAGPGWHEIDQSPIADIGPLSNRVETDALFTAGSPTRARGFQSSPYLLVQERVRVSGLPTRFKREKTTTAGGRSVRTGTYTDGQHWLAFQHGSLSIVLSTNALTTKQLLLYVDRQMCSPLP